ncbi:MAG: hypothetical protein ACI8TQ_001297 [Planctomycetota bacterium]
MLGKRLALETGVELRRFERVERVERFDWWLLTADAGRLVPKFELSDLLLDRLGLSSESI